MKIKFEVDVNLNIKHSQESDLLKLLKIINQKLNTMPTKDEMRAAIASPIKQKADYQQKMQPRLLMNYVL